MKKRICLFIILGIVIVIFFIYINSYKIAFLQAGVTSIDPRDYIDMGFDDNGNEYKVFFQYNDEDIVRLIHLTKNNLGIWKITQKISLADDSSPNVIGWTRLASMSRYNLQANVTLEYETHHLYAGNNAKKMISIPKDLLPSNIAINVHQAGEVYVIHFVSYGDFTELNCIDIDELLTQAGCI